MAEPDHIFVKPLPNLANGNQPAGYPFFYIRPDKHEKIIRKFYPEAITDIDPIGNSPVIIQKVNFQPTIIVIIKHDSFHRGTDFFNISHCWRK